MERQTLPFGKWFLDGKRKKSMRKKRRNVQLLLLGFKLPVTHMASQCSSH